MKIGYNKILCLIAFLKSFMWKERQNVCKQNKYIYNEKDSIILKNID